jgi:predicted nucleic acid-binding Zn ribbon protein
MAKTRSIEDLLKKVLKDLKKKGRLTEEEMAAAWEGAAGSRAAKHTKPVSIRRSVLVVNVDGSPWLYELTTRKKDILAKLGGAIKHKKIKGIRFRIGETRGKS